MRDRTAVSPRGAPRMRAVPEVVFQEIDRVRVKGKDVAVAIFEPLGEKGQVEQSRVDEADLFHQALRLYRSQNWDMAEMQLLNLQKKSPDRKLYATFLERIGFLRQNPPGKDWDGAFTFETK